MYSLLTGDYMAIQSHRSSMTRHLFSILIVALVGGTTQLAYADGNAPPTHAALANELAKLERAGYTPSENDPSYPAGLQLAEQRAQHTSNVTDDARPQSVSDASPIATANAPRETDAIR